MSQVIKPADSDVRLAAINGTQSFAVSAPAGSGKTGLLTQRFLTLLSMCKNPEEVLAITFTRKAAGEMQDRIMHALWQAESMPEPEDEHSKTTWLLAKQVLTHSKDMGWNLTDMPQRLRIQTIDGLCRNITRQLPLSSGLGAQTDTLDSAEMAYRMAVRDLFAMLDDESSPIREDLALLLTQMDNNLPAVESLLVGLLGKRDQWLEILLEAKSGSDNAKPYFEAVIEELIEENLSGLLKSVQIFSGPICEIADKAASNLPVSGEGKNKIHELRGITSLPKTSSADLAGWAALADLFLTNGGTFRARLTKNEGFPAGKEGAVIKEEFTNVVASMAEQIPSIEESLHAVRGLPNPSYEENHWLLLKGLTQVLPVLAAQLMIIFKQQGATDFTAISQAALDALGDETAPTDIALHLDYKISHILVDEFQDTASPQLSLLKKLTAGWQPDDGRTLFIVGDGMQSCYGFRNANVGIFLDARLHGIGSVPLTPLDLTVNFRSQEGVITWINNVFQGAFPAHDDIGRGAVRYSPSEAFKPSLPGNAVEFHLCPVETEAEESDDEDSDFVSAHHSHEAELVVSLVKQAKEDNPDGSIAILVRVRSHLQKILPALNAAGFSYQATDIDALSTRMAILDLVSLTKAMLNTDDRISWLSVLRAPWCGLDNHDLHRLATSEIDGSINPALTENGLPSIWGQLNNFESIQSLSDDAKQILRRVMPVIARAHSERLRKPLRQWIEGLWIALGGPATLLSADDAENAKSFFSLLDSHQKGGNIVDWAAFDQSIQRLYAAPQVNGDSKLQVMTIHKSKGLEFDTVIIPGLERKSRKDDKQLLLWRERINQQGKKRLLLSALSPTGKEDADLYKYMRSEADKQQEFELTRLLYVGCTRAIKKLHLIACLKSKEEGFASPGKNSLLSCIWPSVKENARVYVPTGADEYRVEPAAYHHIARLPSAWSLPALDDVSLLAGFRGKEVEIDDPSNPLNRPIVETTYARLARHCGVLVHDTLQAISDIDIENESANRLINRFMSGWKSQLSQWGWKDDALNRGIEKITASINKTLESSVGRWILSNKHQDAASELSVMHANDGDFKESIIDRTFVADGARWIIDYKSSDPLENESMEAFIAREMETYEPQLRRYKNAMESMGETNVKTGIFFTNIGKLKVYS